MKGPGYGMELYQLASQAKLVPLICFVFFFDKMFCFLKETDFLFFFFDYKKPTFLRKLVPSEPYVFHP